MDTVHSDFLIDIALDRHLPLVISDRVINFTLNYGSSCLSLPATELLSSSSFLTGRIIEEVVTATAKYK